MTSKKKKKDSNTGTKVLACIIAGAALGSHSNGVQHALHATLASIPIAAGSYGTRQAWAATFLAADGMPRTACNNSAVLAWVVREGGGFGNQAANNPLNLNPGAGAGWPGYAATGAWAFPDAGTGLRYTISTVRNYPGIQAALRAGDNAQAVCNAIMASPWAASHYGGTLSASC